MASNNLEEKSSNRNVLKLKKIYRILTFTSSGFGFDEVSTVDEIVKRLDEKIRLCSIHPEICLPSGDIFHWKPISTEQLQELEEKHIVFMFYFKNNSELPLCLSQLSNSPDFSKMMLNPRRKVNYLVQCSLWLEGLNIVKPRYHVVCQVFKFFKDLKVMLTAENNDSKKNTNDLLLKLNYLKGKGSLLKCGIQKDVKEYKNRYYHATEKWNMELNRIETEIGGLSEEVSNLLEQVNGNTVQIKELLKFSLDEKEVKVFEKKHKVIQEYFTTLKNRPEDQKEIQRDNLNFVNLFVSFMDQSLSLIEVLLPNFKKLTEMRSNVKGYQNSFIFLSLKIQELEANVGRCQSDKQQDIANIVKQLLSNAPQESTTAQYNFFRTESSVELPNIPFQLFPEMPPTNNIQDATVNNNNSSVLEPCEVENGIRENENLCKIMEELMMTFEEDIELKRRH